MGQSGGSDGWRSLRRLAPVGAAVLALGVAAPAVAAAPPNDNFADAIELTTPDATTNGTTVGATREPGEHGTGTSVWYRFTAQNTDEFGIDVCRPYTYNAVSVYTGTSVDALTLKKSIAHCALVLKPASAGEVLHIRIRPLWNIPREFELELHPGPENDDFPGTAVPSGATGSPAVDAFAATLEAGEPDRPIWRSVWWSWQPLTGSVAVADVCMDDPEKDGRTVIEAFAGDSISGLQPAADRAVSACRGEYQSSPPSPDDTDNSVVRWTPGPGPVRLRAGSETVMDLRVRSGSPPSGDAFSAPRQVTGSDVHEYYRTPFATAEAGEPQTDGTRLGSATVWFRWTPPGAGTAVFDSCEGQSRIHAYRGSDLAALEQLSNGAYCRQRIAVGDEDSLALQTGIGRLVEADYLDAKWGAAPANDLFANGEVLTGDAPAASGDVAWANRGDEPGKEAGGTVWYQWTATASGIHTADTCGSAADVRPRVSTGWSTGTQVVTGIPGNANPADANDACKWFFDAVKGRNYRIRVLGDPAAGRTGAFDLTLERTRGDGPRDFNGDGADDLAVGVPDRAVGGDASAGAVEIRYGRADGTSTVARTLTQDTYGVADLAEPGDRFGAEMAVADFDGDGFDDLAVASPGEAVGGVAGAGAVHILRGSRDGLVTSGSQLIHKGSVGVPGNPAAGDAFGAALDGAPLDDAAGAELVIGAPGERSARGAAYLMRGSGDGVALATTVRLSEDAGTTPGVGAAGERFGSAVAIGENDVVIGVPNEDVVGIVDAGAVYLLPAEAPTGSDGRIVNQNKASVPDTAESGDHFGAAVATGALTGSEAAGDVLIGAPEEDGKGSVTVLFDGERTPRAEAVRSLYSDVGSRFGSALDVAYGKAAIGAPGERYTSSHVGSGLAWEMWITPTSLTRQFGARGYVANSHVGTDVAILRLRPVGGAAVYGGAPDLDVDGLADAGGVMTGFDMTKILSPSPAAGDHAGAALGS